MNKQSVLEYIQRARAAVNAHNTTLANQYLTSAESALLESDYPMGQGFEPYHQFKDNDYPSNDPVSW